jgi:hypothetical protein
MTSKQSGIMKNRTIMVQPSAASAIATAASTSYTHTHTYTHTRMRSSSSSSSIHNTAWMILFSVLVIYTSTVASLGLLSFNVTTSSSSSSSSSPLSFTSVSFNPCRWGAMLGDGTHHYDLVAASGTLCDTTTNITHDYSNKAVIVMRGSCAFSKKALTAQLYNASLVIIYNCQPGVCKTSS